MVYLFEKELNEDQIVYISLARIYGIGKNNSIFLCKRLGWSKNIKIKNLAENQIYQLAKIIENSDFIVATDLKKIKSLVLKKYISMKSYKGLRRYRGLPVRGQRTHTNAKTAKNKKGF